MGWWLVSAAVGESQQLRVASPERSGLPLGGARCGLLKRMLYGEREAAALCFISHLPSRPACTLLRVGP